MAIFPTKDGMPPSRKAKNASDETIEDEGIPLQTLDETLVLVGLCCGFGSGPSPAPPTPEHVARPSCPV